MKKDQFKAFWLNNKKRNLKILIAALAVMLVFTGIYHGVRISKWLNQVDQDAGINFDNADETYVEDETDFEAIHEAENAVSLEDMLYKWSTNGGEKMAGKDVVNVLLIGVDSTDGLASGGNTDAMMIVSLNKETKKITIVSIMRDSFVYMDINGKKRFFKINAAYNWGGPATLLKVVEDSYKVEINNYVCVDFATFPKIIDALGGVRVEVKPYEAAHIRNLYGLNITAGESVLLDGQTALVFSRIRQSDADGDVSRTRRQRAVIMAMIAGVRDASNAQFNSTLDVIFPNIRTNYGKSEMLSLGTQALMQKWADFEIVQLTSPAETTRASATIDGRFVWVVDFPVEASAVQLAMYGSTNIVLEPDRVSALNMLKPKKSAAAVTGTSAAATTTAAQPNDHSTTVDSDEPTTQKETSTAKVPPTSGAPETTAR